MKNILRNAVATAGFLVICACGDSGSFETGGATAQDQSAVAERQNQLASIENELAPLFEPFLRCMKTYDPARYQAMLQQGNMPQPIRDQIDSQANQMSRQECARFAQSNWDKIAQLMLRHQQVETGNANLTLRELGTGSLQELTAGNRQQANALQGGGFDYRGSQIDHAQKQADFERYLRGIQADSERRSQQNAAASRAIVGTNDE